jgi:hypothetical protein
MSRIIPRYEGAGHKCIYIRRELGFGYSTIPSRRHICRICGLRVIPPNGYECTEIEDVVKCGRSYLENKIYLDCKSKAPFEVRMKVKSLSLRYIPKFPSNNG